jgi:hypothetical protein
MNPDEQETEFGVPIPMIQSGFMCPIDYDLADEKKRLVRFDWQVLNHMIYKIHHISAQPDKDSIAIGVNHQ